MKTQQELEEVQSDIECQQRKIAKELELVMSVLLGGLGTEEDILANVNRLRFGQAKQDMLTLRLNDLIKLAELKRILAYRRENLSEFQYRVNELLTTIPEIEAEIAELEQEVQ